jgi:hypothetical protein
MVIGASTKFYILNAHSRLHEFGVMILFHLTFSLLCDNVFFMFGGGFYVQVKTFHVFGL